MLGAIGGIAVGLSGLLAAALQAIGGTRFVVDIGPGETLNATECARRLIGAAHGTDCLAARSDWIFEVITYRLAAAVLGLAALATFVVLRRRGWPMLPTLIADPVGAVLFAGAAAGTAVMAASMLAANSGHGAGTWLSATPVALVAAAVYLERFLKYLRA